MAKRVPQSLKQHAFRDKLLLNQWLISLFGIDPLSTQPNDRQDRPFYRLAAPVKNPELEGLDNDNLHHFYHALVSSGLLRSTSCELTAEQILVYEQNIVRHTHVINERRQRPVVWKYYQWLTLLFVEIYLDRFFGNREMMLYDLNNFVERFNRRWTEYADIAPYNNDDLNKLCLQNATGSGKTLLMHINLLQYRYYANKYGKGDELSRVILLTPNERLSEQHITEFWESKITASNFAREGHSLFTQDIGLGRVDILEITKLSEREGPNTVATRSLGDRNLLLVDEGHRGISGRDAKKNESAWFKNRSMLCEKGFTFEYSATFEQAVRGTGHEDDYAKTVLFDYSYRWFYEDGFGKDYQILNLPTSFTEVRNVYLTACLLKFYQQLRIYEERSGILEQFNIEKPLWVFVGSTVSSAQKGNNDEKIAATDVAQIIEFIADFLNNRQESEKRIESILTGTGHDTGLIDSGGVDLFTGAFAYLARRRNSETVSGLYRDILSRLFHNSAGGTLTLERTKGESGEIVLRVGAAETAFGLISVGDAKGLSDHIANVADQQGIHLNIGESDFADGLFASVKDSTSPVNLLIGSKKFVEGWDCWRVSTMGLMHVGKSEGAQIIQLFGRGVRLKGFQWSLKRSGHVPASTPPEFIEELETLNVFGIEADFMDRFRDYLTSEGLPGNERRRVITIPLNVTYDMGKKLKILRARRKSDGTEYDFNSDGPVPGIGDVPEYLRQNKIVSDWYPRIQSIRSRERIVQTQKTEVTLGEQHRALLDEDALFFDLEQFRHERGWYNLNISKEGIRQLLSCNNWYTLYIPDSVQQPTSFAGVRLLQQVALELVKRYCERYYKYCKQAYIGPRLELRELTRDDDNLPEEGEPYQIVVDGNDEQLIQDIEHLKIELEAQKDSLLSVRNLKVCNFGRHLFQPLFHIQRGHTITVLPVSLNESEYKFVEDLQVWCNRNEKELQDSNKEVFLLRNMSRGKGIGFFEAGNFHPDFILWVLTGDKQYITFIEPHGLIHETPGSPKVMLYKSIKDIEQRLNDPNVVLNSFILSWTKMADLRWDMNQQELEDRHIFFMKDDYNYIDRVFARMMEIKK